MSYYTNALKCMLLFIKSGYFVVVDLRRQERLHSPFNCHIYSRWEDADADVACRQLGIGSGVAVTSDDFGSGEGDIWLDNVECVGDENSLAECDHNGWGDHNCQHHEDAGVVCFGKSELTYRWFNAKKRNSSALAM